MKYRTRAKIYEWGCDYIIEEQKSIFSDWKVVMRSHDPKLIEIAVTKLKEYKTTYYEEKQK